MYQPVPKATGKDKYQITTWQQYCEMVREVALGLRAIGVGKGDIVTIYSETRAEFYIADIGVMTNGSVAAALYTSYPMSEQVRNLRLAAPRAMIVENEKAMHGLQEALAGEPFDVKWIVLTGAAPGAITLDELRNAGRQLESDQPDMFERIQAEYTDRDYAILYLTSGATGEPKMGLVTHSAIVTNIDTAPEVLPISPEDRSVVFLPSAHIAQRVVLEMVPLRMGMPVWFSESLAKLPGEMRSVRPTFMLAPPRVWERIYSTIWTEIRKKSGLAQRLFYTAIGVGSEAARLKQEGKPVPALLNATWKLFDRLVYRKIRERLGGALRIAASGAAPLGRELAQFYAAIGMPLVEGYGLTEGGVVALNPIDRPKPGSIGKLLPNRGATG
jgi:long-chain acyl-CoA synthetase